MYKYSPDFENHEESGFYHDYPEDAYEIAYIINGTVKNIAGYTLGIVKVIARLYDVNDNFYWGLNTWTNDLINSKTWDFSMEMAKGMFGWFDEIDHLDLYFEIY